MNKKEMKMQKEVMQKIKALLATDERLNNTKLEVTFKAKEPTKEAMSK